MKTHNHRGYPTVRLTKLGKGKNITLHRLVAITFISNINNLQYVNHIDGDKLNNGVNNLEWVTPSENTKHAFKIGNINHWGDNNPKRIKKFRMAHPDITIKKETRMDRWKNTHIPGEWKDIPGFEGRYQVDPLGRIKSLNWRSTGTENLLKLSITVSNKGKTKHQYISVSKNKKRVCLRVARIVAGVFIPNTDKKPFVNHIDGNTFNNKVENLEWVTASENNAHAIRMGLNTLPRPLNSGKKHVFVNKEGLQFYRTVMEMKREFKINSNSLYSLVNGKVPENIAQGWRIKDDAQKEIS